ncbi:MAG: DUF3592 domain-containing protein [Litoreibacter sp.]|uniref:DUF3592 domain-containing protein n=1 Tax=Litoreibacter sp. TaxID=1969459 RepID=UPI003299E686
MAKRRNASPLGWGLIGILLGIGLVFLFLGNLDRIIWSFTNHGERVAGRVVDMHSSRIPASNTYLTYVPRVEFTDPGGQERVMSVSSGSSHYDFRKGDRVTVLWRPATQTIAIDIPFRRHFGMSIMLWGLTLLGLAAVFAAGWHLFGGIMHRRRKNRSVE